MGYRTAAPRTKRIVVIRPSPLLNGVLIALGGLMFLAFTVPPSLAFVASVFRGERQGDVGWGVGFLCIAFNFIGVMLGVWSWRVVTTVVRFEIDDDLVVMEWRRAGRFLRSEQVPRAEIVDVAIDTTPTSSDNDVYRLVVGTRHGDIQLADGYTAGRASYEANATRLQLALEVPRRPS